MFFSTKKHLKLANLFDSKDQKSSKNVSFCDIWLNAIIHESLKFFKKCGFFAIFGKRILRYARVSLWRRSPTGELPSNPAPKATFLEKNRTSVDDCAPRNAPKIGFFERFEGLSDLKNWPTLGGVLSKKKHP